MRDERLLEVLHDAWEELSQTLDAIIAHGSRMKKIIDDGGED